VLQKTGSANTMHAILQIPKLISVYVVEILFACLTFHKTGEIIGGNFRLLLIRVTFLKIDLFEFFQGVFAVIDWVEFSLKVF